MCIEKLVCPIISAFAALCSAITAIISYHNGKLLAHGDIELQIRNMISEARARCLNCNSIQKKAFEEDLLNAYDEACAKYLDKKVSQDRFERMYASEIRNLIEAPNFKDIFSDPSCNYDAILKVYKKWNHKD